MRWGSARSIYWTRRPFEGRDARDHLLFALFVTGRVGLWLALAGIFLIYALTNTQGRAFTDDARRYDWFFMVFVVLAAMQLDRWVLPRASIGQVIETLRGCAVPVETRSVSREGCYK